jgi:hypothetical protein
MKLQNIILLLICALPFCARIDNPAPKEKPDLSDTDFIYLKDNHFCLREKLYFPIMLNYILSYRNINDQFIVSPNIDYEHVGVYESNTKEEIAEQFRAHFQLIKEMGFNSLRICFDRLYYDAEGHSYHADGKKFFVQSDHEVILSALDDMLRIAQEKELRIMLLIKNPSEGNDLHDFTTQILKRFKDDPIIFAYDFINEPLYFDKAKNRTKKDACSIVSGWKKMMEVHAPNQLFTIGFSEPIEVFEWDPAMLPVDFIALHTYHPLRVKNEVYWYSAYTNKPWMIGETSLPAENDSISYEEQAVFMRDLYRYVRDCGGAGFGWWDFQEATAGNFEAKYAGILNHEGTATTQDGKYTIAGAIKPAAKEIMHFSEYVPQEKIRPANYFNMMGYNNIVIKGTILNKKTKKPIEGAVVRGWNEPWSVGQNTYTDENGRFTLYSNDFCTHFEISAPNMEKIRFSRKLDYNQIVKVKYDLNHLPNQLLEYHYISYVPFLKENAVSTFDFDPEYFNQSKFEGQMETIYLAPLKPCN